MLLKAQNIRKSYHQTDQELEVLKGVNLEIKEGEVISLIGPSGAGKSTLLHILGGLDQPSHGKVNFLDQDLYQLSEDERAEFRNKSVGFIFQFYHLLPEFNALENVIMPAVIKEQKANIKYFEEKGLKLLDDVGLRARAVHKPNQLSGGEQQRVAIARSIMNDPKLIFCDEPTGNLDSQTGARIIDLLMELSERHHQTLMIVTHDDNIAKRSTKTLNICDGQLVP